MTIKSITRDVFPGAGIRQKRPQLSPFRWNFHFWAHTTSMGPVALKMWWRLIMWIDISGTLLLQCSHHSGMVPDSRAAASNGAPSPPASLSTNEANSSFSQRACNRNSRGILSSLRPDMGGTGLRQVAKWAPDALRKSCVLPAWTHLKASAIIWTADCAPGRSVSASSLFFRTVPLLRPPPTVLNAGSTSLLSGVPSLCNAYLAMFTGEWFPATWVLMAPPPPAVDATSSDYQYSKSSNKQGLPGGLRRWLNAGQQLIIQVGFPRRDGDPISLFSENSMNRGTLREAGHKVFKRGRGHGRLASLLPTRVPLSYNLHLKQTETSFSFSPTLCGTLVLILITPPCNSLVFIKPLLELSFFNFNTITLESDNDHFFNRKIYSAGILATLF